MPGPAGFPGAPGSGRRRRGYDPLADTGGFAAVRPQDLDGPPPTHPEHREHAAWGAAGGWAPGRGHGSARELAPEPVDPWTEEWPPVPSGPRGGLPRQIPQIQVAGAIPRPRQEFLDAFDTPTAPEPTAAGPTATDPAARPGAGPGGTGSGTGSGTGPEKDHENETGGAKSRTLGGIAAAAVVTVLAVVVTGQVTGGEKKHTGSAGKNAATRTSEGDDARTRPRTAPTSAAPTATAAPTYAALMARTYPLDPRLSLSGAFVTMPGHQAAPGRGTVLRFRVDVEKGLPLDAGLFTQTVFRTLNDSRSWGHGGKMTFERVSTGPADIVVTLASPGTTAKWCAKSGLDTAVENVSCDAASTPRTMINAYRWAQGATTYGPGRIHAYRQMLINHEVGHRLGHGHVGCTKEGAPAPVMMQQTKFLSLDGGPTCTPNAWPFP